jgi:hypothetical protein
MPGMTAGVALANATLSEFRGLPVIIATGYAELPDGSGKNLPKLANSSRKTLPAR